MNMKALTVAMMSAGMAFSGSAFAKEEGLSYNGYARMVAGFNTEKNNSEHEAQAYNAVRNGIAIIKAPSSPQQPGRIGNEGTGMELGINYHQKSENAGDWDIYFMADDGYGWQRDHNDSTTYNLRMAQAFAGGSNLFESQKDMYVWAGKRFNGRAQFGLNDYFYFMNDGAGGGFDNMDFGMAKFDLAVVSGDNGNNGRYAVTSKLHSIEVGSGSIGFNFNYGFGDQSDEHDPKHVTSLQAAAFYKVGWSMGTNEFAIRYNDNVSDNNLLDAGQIKGDINSTAFYWFGNLGLSDSFAIDYGYSFEQSDLENNDESTWNQFVIKPHYRWSNIHSTSFEFGYDSVDFKDNQDESAWKVSIQQNMSMGSFLWSRPEIRFFVTHGEVKVGDKTTPATNVGMMFDAWW
jgi:maltoporin